MIESSYDRHEVLQGDHAVPPEDVLFGTTPTVRALQRTADKLAVTTAPVLITGETGTGKEVLAKYLHRKSPWADSPFFKLSCPLFRFPPVEGDPLAKTIADMNSLLRPTPARQTPIHGTLLLDNIAFLDMVMQVRLLEKLSEKPILYIRLPKGEAIELRLICTANRPLDRLVRKGHFLRELDYLVRVFTLKLPPLRERREDLPQITSYLLDLYNRKFATPRLPPSPFIFERMRAYDWPGNLRELENLIMRYVVQGSDTVFIREFSGHRGPPFSPGVLSR